MEKDPTKIEKLWKYAGLKCAIIHHGSHRCGYVSVPKTHIAYGIYYDDVHVNVHGGLTFSDYAKHNKYLKGKDTYWFGFDCAHAGDQYRTPNLLRTFTEGSTGTGHWWTLEEVVEETNKLAEQLVALQESQTLPFEVREWLKTHSLAKIKKVKKELEVE